MTMSATTYPNLIHGEWESVGDGEFIENRNPAKPDELIGLFPKATLNDTRRAISSARAALPGWAAMPAPERGAILEKASQLITARVEELSTILTREEGKTFAEAKGEVIRARDIFRYYGGEGWRYGGRVLPSSRTDELLYTRREPLGVVSIITPWNFPIAIPAWKVAPALAYGNFLTGDGPSVGGEMTSHPDVNGISFTGSYEVGTQIYQKAIKNMTRVQLEMGGKNALVVLKDANLDLAVELAVKGGFGLTWWNPPKISSSGTA
jgi:aldehyde dehydrogenase (NAD+)